MRAASSTPSITASNANAEYSIVSSRSSTNSSPVSIISQDYMISIVPIQLLRVRAARSPAAASWNVTDWWIS